MICLPNDKRALLEPEHPSLSLRKQCELLDINRSSIYYKPVNVSVRDDKRLSLMHLVDSIYTEYPFFGTRKMASYLQLNGNRDIKRHHIRGIYEQLGLRSVAPGPHTSKPHSEHKKYPYLLRGIDINKPNQV